jgi:tetratricopeptide (TPR) repeat protein
MKITQPRIVLPLAVAALLQVATVHADGPGAYRSGSAGPQQPPAVQAQNAYDAGVAFLEQAARHEQLAEAGDGGRASDKARAAAAKAYKKALAQFEIARRIDPASYEAHTYAGFANRKLGRYDRSLDAYAAALRLKPDYGPAVEYQGEAFLALDRLQDAKLNYLRLYALAPPLADKLLAAMQKWLETRKVDAQGADPAEIDAMARWVSEQTSRQSRSAGSEDAAAAW